MHLRAAAAVTSLALVLLAACGGDDSKASDKSTTSSSRATTTSTTAGGTDTSCAAADPAELASLLEVPVPAGFEVQPDDVGDTGPSDLKKAISDDGEDDAAEALRAAGFRRGYQRLWSKDENTGVVAFVYDFCTAAGADAYAARGGRLDAEGGATVFAVNDLVGAVGYSGSDDDGSVYADVLTSPGTFVVVAESFGSGDAFTTAAIEQLATDLASGLVAKVGSPS
jgi:hypothetical protein